jgi:putative transposase
MSGTFFNIKLHLVFSTKHRQALITPDVAPRLYEYMGGVTRGLGGTLLEIGGMPDHVHLLVGWKTDPSISDLMREVKSESSQWVHITYPVLREFSWQAGYGAFSVSHSQVDRVRGYIRTQSVHHNQQRYEDEFLGLLRAHGIEFDERYVFD